MMKNKPLIIHERTQITEIDPKEGEKPPIMSIFAMWKEEEEIAD